MTLAIFDLDNTLLAGDSDHAWGEFLVEESIVDAEEYRQANDRFYEEYLNGELDIMRYLSFALQPLARYDTEQLLAWREQFMAKKIQPMMLEKAKALLDSHRADGHTLMIITATNRFVTEPVAKLLPSFQDGKVARLNDWLESTGESLEGAWFYSDSHNDAPLLRKVENPVAVDPDPTLENIAKENGWKIMSLRG